MIRLSPAEGLVFFDWFANLFDKEIKKVPDRDAADEGDEISTWSPELQAMSIVQGLLERQINCVFASNYSEILEEARAALVDPDGDSTIDRGLD